MSSKDLSFVLLGEDKSASKTMSDTATNAEKATGRIGGAFSKIGSAIGGEFGDILGRVGDGISKVGDHAGKLSSSLVGGGGVITGVGVALQGMGSADKQATDQLKQSVTDSGKSWDDYKDGVEKAISKQEGFGHSAVDTQGALQKLVQATNDPKKALADMGLVANLAAAKHISLSDAAGLVARVLGGSGGKVLSQYGVSMGTVTGSAAQLAKANAGVASASTGLQTAQNNLVAVQDRLHGKTNLTAADHLALQKAQDAVHVASGKLSTAQDTLAKAHAGSSSKAAAGQVALDELSKKINGQATSSVNNFGGQVNIMKTRLGDWAATMGQKVGPVLTALGPALSIVGVALQLMRTRQELATAAQVAGTVATKGSTIATGLATAGQWLLNVAMDANPIGIVILAIAALVVGFLLLWTFCKPFREFMISMFKDIAVGATWLWKNAIMPAIDGIGTVFKWVWNSVLVPFAEFFWTAVRTIVDVGGTVFGAIGGVIRGAFNGVVSFVKGIFNTIIDVVNHIIDGINTATSMGAVIGIKIGAIPHLPHLAIGGTMLSSGLAMVGEKGPEVVRLPAGATVFPHGTAAGGGGGGTTVVINIHGVMASDKTSMAKLVQDAWNHAVKTGGVPRNGLTIA